MKYINNITIALLVFSSGFFFYSCTETDGCTDPIALNYDPDADSDDGSCTYADHSEVTFRFTQVFDDQEVSSATFNQFNYITEDGDTINITRLRYLISDIRLYTADGDSIVIEGYQLVDVTNGTGLTFSPDVEIPTGIYTGISFIFGFDDEDNIENEYPDLNVANWNWPDMLGGGYHFMQMEGMFKDQGVDMPYAYHHGTARVDVGVFESNFFKADLDGIVLQQHHAEVEIIMNIAEWYRNPNLWDLNTLSVMLMPNYDAQKMMQANGSSVFSLGDVSQEN